METNQPDALRLAAILSNEFDTYTDTWSAKEAAAELRRLHDENETLRTGYDATCAARAATTASAPVVLPEPDAVLRFERSTAGKENEMPIVVSCNWLPDGEYKLYTEQQVRDMLATGWHHRKPNCITCNDHGEVGNIITAEPCPDCTPPHALADVQRDAQRYRWLRKQQWRDGELCVVAQPKKSVKLGSDCKSLDRLDGFIDAARAAQEGK